MRARKLLPPWKTVGWVMTSHSCPCSVGGRPPGRPSPTARRSVGTGRPDAAPGRGFRRSVLYPSRSPWSRRYSCVVRRISAVMSFARRSPAARRQPPCGRSRPRGRELHVVASRARSPAHRALSLACLGLLRVPPRCLGLSPALLGAPSVPFITPALALRLLPSLFGCFARGLLYFRLLGSTLALDFGPRLARSRRLWSAAGGGAVHPGTLPLLRLGAPPDRLACPARPSCVSSSPESGWTARRRARGLALAPVALGCMGKVGGGGRN